MRSDLNGGESHYVPLACNLETWAAIKPTARAISCSLETVADEAIELLTLIDQPSYWNEEKVWNPACSTSSKDQTLRHSSEG